MCSCQWGYKSKLRFKGQQHRTSVHGLHICSALRFASQLIWWLEVLWTLLWASMSFEPRLAAGRRVLAAEVKRQRAEATQLSFCCPKTMDEKHICQELWKFRAQQGTDMMNVPINVVLVIPGWTLALRHWRIIPKAWPNPWKLWKLWKPMVSAPTHCYIRNSTTSWLKQFMTLNRVFPVENRSRDFLELIMSSPLPSALLLPHRSQVHAPAWRALLRAFCKWGGPNFV